MFSDLVGSTALSGAWIRRICARWISAYQNCVAEIVRRFGGFVAEVHG